MDGAALTALVLLAALAALPHGMAEDGDVAVVMSDDHRLTLVGRYTSGTACPQTWQFYLTMADGTARGGFLSGCWETGFSGTLGPFALASTPVTISGRGSNIAYCTEPLTPHEADVVVTVDGVAYAAHATVLDAVCVAA